MALKELLKRGIGKLLKNKKTDPVNRLKPVEYGMVSDEIVKVIADGRI